MLKIWHRSYANKKRGFKITIYMKKGSMVLVIGRLTTRSWEKDGHKNYRTEIVVEDFKFGPKPAGASSGTAQPKSDTTDSTEEPEEDINPDDIPF